MENEINPNKLKEVRFMLNNYKKIDRMIDKRKDQLFSKIKTGKNAWLMAKTQIKGSTIEDIVSDMEDDKIIKRLKCWKWIIQDFTKKVYLNEDYIISSFFKLKYLEKKENITISKSLELNNEEIDYIDDKIIEGLYKHAKECNFYYINGDMDDIWKSNSNS